MYASKYAVVAQGPLQYIFWPHEGLKRLNNTNVTHSVMDEYPVGCHSNNYRKLQPYSLHSIKV